MKRLILITLALVAVAALVYGCVAYGHTAVRPDENPPPAQRYHVPHGTCTDTVNNGVPVRNCWVTVQGQLLFVGPIGRHVDPVKFIEKKVNFK